jgi:tetratricopeptide (TPR) repeat protein
MIRSTLALLAVALTLGTATVAFCQSRDAADAAYDEGRRLYDLREWDDAIAKFKEAYKLRPEPRSLFNIAQSYRLKGDCAEASGFYKTYLRNYPDAPNAAKVQQFVTELEPCANRAPVQHEPPPSENPPQQDHPAPVAPTDQPTPAPPQPTVALPQPTPSQHSHAVPLALSLVSFGLVGGGVGLELLGESTYDQAKRATTAVSQQSLYDSANHKRYAAEAVGVAGVGCAAVAIWLYIRDRGESPTATARRELVVSPAGIAIVGSF